MNSPCKAPVAVLGSVSGDSALCPLSLGQCLLRPGAWWPEQDAELRIPRGRTHPSSPCLLRSSGERGDRGIRQGWGMGGLEMSSPERRGLPSGGTGKGCQPWDLSPLSGPSCQHGEPPSISALHPRAGGLPAGRPRMKLKALGLGWWAGAPLELLMAAMVTR